jgi:hypothetical protein
VQWAEDGRPCQRTVALSVTATRQPLGGGRRRWRCPVCRRRWPRLAAVTPAAPIACRVCLQGRYVTDYPSRDRHGQFVALVHSLLDGSVVDREAERELDSLLARRRRGVRRGRRLYIRAIRSLTRLRARCEAVTGTLARDPLSRLWSASRDQSQRPPVDHLRSSPPAVSMQPLSVRRERPRHRGCDRSPLRAEALRRGPVTSVALALTPLHGGHVFPPCGAEFTARASVQYSRRERSERRPHRVARSSRGERQS